MRYIHQPHSPRRLGDYLNDNLSQSWTHFRAAVAFVKRTGTRHILNRLSAFSERGDVEIIAGVDHRGTSKEGLVDLLNATGPNGRVILFHNPLPFTFHPKLYLFKSADRAEALIGSGNLTEGGLYTNYESTVQLVFDLSNSEDADAVRSIELDLDHWSDLATGNALTLDAELLERLTADGLVPPEALSATYIQVPPPVGPPASIAGSPMKDLASPPTPFIARGVPPPPVASSNKRTARVPTATHPPQVEPQSPDSSPCTYTDFVITLQQTDVGGGQTTSGTSRRSPEIFIPLTARDACPDFWDWPSAFALDDNKPKQRDRMGVRMKMGTELITVNMMEWLPKKDLRIRSERLRSAGNVGDILRLQKAPEDSGCDYIVEVVPTTDDRHAGYLALCNRSVRNSRKRYGYY